MKTFLFFAFLVFVSCQSKQLEYSDFLECEEAYQWALYLKSQSNYKDAIVQFELADKSINNFPASKEMAECYMHLGETNKALDLATIAFQRGFPVTSFDEHLFATVWSELEREFKVNSTSYYQTVDTLLRNELSQMIMNDQKIRLNPQSIEKMMEIDLYNINRLKEICRSKGWPGRRLLGYGRIPDPSILVIHASERDNIFFLDLVVRASLKNEASWFSARAIMINLLWRFDDDGYNKLRHTYVDSHGELDTIRSFFQLSSLATFLNDNTEKGIVLLGFHNSQSFSEKRTRMEQLEQIKRFLSNAGIRDDRVRIQKETMKVKPDEFGGYNFGFELQ